MVDWAPEQKKRWGALPLGESPKFVPSLSSLLRVPLSKSGAAPPEPVPAAPDTLFLRRYL